MKIALVLFSLALSIPGMVAADAARTGPESWDRFVAEMQVLYGSQPVLIRAITKKQVRIELCPDNTCVGIKAPRSASSEVVADFFYLFEFYAAPYYEQEREWKPKKEVAEYAQGLLSKYRALAKCEAASETKVAHCVLRHLEKTRGIRPSVIRDDEGRRVTSPARIDEFFGQ
ncbi:MAG: hypothetical protein Q8O37_03910 [Sulfuricellaceae bacterium]|nr:hypothetical protein [Sulfuricellaceae bacterium]